MGDCVGVLPSELKKLMDEGKVPHAVALESDDEASLTAAAAELAAYAVCKGEKRPCGRCKGCMKAKSGNHPDIYTAALEGKKQIVKISEIRKICADSIIKPNESDCKVYIIPNADNMETAAQNAFLKLMEEPPQPMLFILLCADSSGLLMTIRSRCTAFHLEGNAKAQLGQLAEDIARAICSDREIDLVYALAALNERTQAVEALTRLSECLREAAVCSITGKGSDDIIRKLSLSVSVKGLMKMQEDIFKAREYIDRNVGLNLVGTVLSVNLNNSRYL